MPQGGKFDVHADRNIAYETGLARRLSLIIYLNKAWQHEYGGQLELWNHDGNRPGSCDRTPVQPDGNFRNRRSELSRSSGADRESGRSVPHFVRGLLPHRAASEHDSAQLIVSY